VRAHAGAGSHRLWPRRRGNGLTDLLDDHTRAAGPGERDVIAPALWLTAGKAALAFAGRWVSHGKWLLREFDPALAESWPAARDHPVTFTGWVLDEAGGRLPGPSGQEPRLRTIRMTIAAISRTAAVTAAAILAAL
jgi:hypothetical protein